MYLYVIRRSTHICWCVVNTGRWVVVSANKKMVRTGWRRSIRRCVVNTGGRVKADLTKTREFGIPSVLSP